MKNDKELKQIILGTIVDLVTDFIYFDRKEDEDLDIYALKDAISRGVITKEEIVKQFKESIDISI